MRILTLLSGLGLALLVATSASAVTIYQTSLDGDTCATCQGLDMTLTITDNMDGTLTAVYTLNSDGYTGDRDGVVKIGFGGITGWEEGDVTMTSSPNSGWSDPMESQISSSGYNCDGNGNTNKLCIKGFTDITGGGDYTWEFEFADGTVKVDPSEWHFGAQFGNEGVYLRGQIISEAGRGVIPEPSAALVFSLGMLVTGARARRVRR